MNDKPLRIMLRSFSKEALLTLAEKQGITPTQLMINLIADAFDAQDDNHDTTNR